MHTDHRYIKGVIILFEGFTRSTGDPTGIEEMWSALFIHRDGIHRSRTLLEPRTWKESPRAIAEWIRRRCPPDAKIMLIGFSYGAGWTCPHVARALRRLGRNVELMMLIDPVWRARWLSLKWLSLTGRIPVRVPWNVLEVQSWRQHGDGWHGGGLIGFIRRIFDPKGSRLTIEDRKRTRVRAETIVLGATHTSIQHMPAIQQQVVARAIELIDRVRGEQKEAA